MASPADIRQGVIEPGDPGPLGYRRLTTRPPEPHVPRGGPGQRLHGILCFVHLTDLHVTDAQSPARLDFLDRLGDRDSPHAAGLGRVGTYRPQEPFDWPQQARIVELAADESGRLVVACTSLDHHGLIDPRLGALDDPLTLAGWSRELAANQWQPVRNAAGTSQDRNVILG
jgi:hypothetical protein